MIQFCEEVVLNDEPDEDLPKGPLLYPILIVKDKIIGSQLYVCAKCDRVQ